MVGMASTKENSAAVRRSTPISSAVMMVAPDRDVPGIMASAWPSPTSTAARGPISGTLWMLGAGRSFSMAIMAMPPRMSATETTQGLNSSVVIVL